MRRVMETVWLVLFLGGCATTGSKFTRIDKYPDGEQTSILIGGLMSGLKDANTEAIIFPAPVEKVWPAVKAAAAKFAKVGGRSVVGIDEDNNRVQSGRIAGDSLIGSGTFAWLDEFVMEATSLADSTTRVSVTRKVVENEINSSTLKKTWKTQWSNGKIERWLLTQVWDALGR